MQDVENRPCDCRHPPVCRNYKSGNCCIHGSYCLYRHADGEETPSKKSKKEGTKGAVAILKEKKKGPRLCVSKIFRSKEVCSAESWANEIGRFGGTRFLNSQDALGTKFKFGKEKGHFDALSKKVNLMSEIFARRSLRKEHLTKPHDKKSTPAKRHGIWRHKYVNSRSRTMLRSVLRTPSPSKNLA